MSQLEAVDTGSHILGIYSNDKQELEGCFAFLKAGFENNEALWVVEEDLTKGQIEERMRKELSIKNLEELEAKGLITITTVRE